MGPFLEFILKYWIIIILVISIILAIIGYIIESNNLDKNKDKKVIKKDENNKSQTENLTQYNDDIIYENVKDENKQNYISENDNKINVKMCDILKEQEIKDSIQEIIVNKEFNLDEKDLELLEKKPINDLKDKFDNLALTIDPILNPKIKKHIDTNIKLPNIELNDDRNIWN